MPAIGTAGGILVGVKQDDFEIISVDILQFSVACLIKDRKDGKIWRFITVYGVA